VGRFIILFFLFVFANASSVLNISYFPLNNKIDILFSLDKPFNGKIMSLSQNSYKITNINLNRIEQKKFPNNLNIIISPLDENSINLKLNYKKSLNIKASVTAKGYGLRIRIIGLKNKKSILKTKDIQNQNLSNLNVNNSFNYINYIMVIAILIFLIIILFYIKKKTLQKLPKSLQQDNYKVLYQKMIDPKNRLVMIEVFDKRYLLLLGDKNNILLDDFSKESQEDLKDISSQNEFGKLLDEKLDDDRLNFIKNASKLKENDEF
jgi:flagellar biogenesis protein FliO